MIFNPELAFEARCVMRIDQFNKTYVVDPEELV